MEERTNKEDSCERNGEKPCGHEKRQAKWPAVSLNSAGERSVGYFPGLAGTEAGAGLEPSSTECVPVECTYSTVRLIEVSMKITADQVVRRVGRPALLQQDHTNQKQAHNHVQDNDEIEKDVHSVSCFPGLARLARKRRIFGAEKGT